MPHTLIWHPLTNLPVCANCNMPASCFEETPCPGEIGPIYYFRDKWGFLSNMYPVSIPGRWKLNGKPVIWPSVEHAFVASKTKNPAEKAQVLQEPNSGQAKKLGQTFQLRPDWESIKPDIMLSLLQIKFGPLHPDLQQKLLATGDRELIEGNWWGDNYWGKVYKKGFYVVATPYGQNILGQLLMKVRADLRGGKS